MARGPNHTGRGPAHLTVLPGGAQRPVEEDERTTIDPTPPDERDEIQTPIGTPSGTADEHWEDGTTVAESAKKMLEEPTIDEQARALPPLQLVPPVNPRALARLTVTAGPDLGRTYELAGGAKSTLIGRAVENDIVLTDLSVSRRHLELAWDGNAWVLRDCGSGNGTLINDRLEDGRCQLRHGDRIEIGNTIFRFDHPASAEGEASVDVPMTGWGQSDDDDELATVNGRVGRVTGETVSPEHARQLAAAPARRVAPPTTPPARPSRIDVTVPPIPRARPNGGPA
ncbi:MAG TPA: FHA domain-containing protein, partial [Kofleriaceae bacterium]|nr:FHA domain-containing protein [Kofleriaceae bacterium]